MFKKLIISSILTQACLATYTHRQGLGSPHVVTGKDPPQEQWFQQQLDHFKAAETRTWQQRYWMNWEYYKPGGPIFLMIGGEGEANPAWMSAGSWQEYGAAEHAVLILLEHRYYGKSRPTPNLSVKNLNWLSSRQALADIATFIQAMNNKHNFSGRWITLGGSYPGSLAAWSRLKYPHLIGGAVSTSGPLRAKTDFYEYLDVVLDALETTAKGCSSALLEAMRKVQILAVHPVGWNMITSKFKLCQKFEGNNLADVISLYESLIGNFEGVVQYNKDNRDFEGVEWGNVTIETLCSIMTDQKIGSELVRLEEVNNLGLRMSSEKCLDHVYIKQIRDLKETEWTSDAANGGRQWLYQTCTEFGWYQSTDSQSVSWGNLIPVRYFEHMCKDIYGPKFGPRLIEQAVEETNAHYGGMNIQVSNVVFVHGSIDPWHAMGITNTTKKGMEAIYIPGTAHCANMYPPKQDDPQQLKDARARVGQLISTWVRSKRE